MIARDGWGPISEVFHGEETDLSVSRLLAKFGICYSVNTFPSNCLLYIWRLFIADYHSAILNEHIANEYLLALFEIRFIPKRQHFSITTMQQMLQEECWSRRDFQYKVVARIYSLINFNSDSNFIRAKCIWDYYPVKQIGRNMKLVFRISASSSLITWLAKAPEEMSLQKAQ